MQPVKGKVPESVWEKAQVLASRQPLGALDRREDNANTGRAIHLDARPAGRFHGEAPEPRPNMRLGHVPKSLSLPAGSMLRGSRLGLTAPPELDGLG